MPKDHFTLHFSLGLRAPLARSLPFQAIPLELATAINDLVYIINHWAEKKEWNDDIREFGQHVPRLLYDRLLLMYKSEKIALIHTELSEAVEYLRKPDQNPMGEPIPQMDDKCPELTGEEAEMADTVIRILHYCGEFGIDLGRAVQIKHAFNITRPIRHGKAS